jgi:hypothetical protein
MTDMTEKGSDFVKDLGDAARRNPISAALIGMGIVWLFAGEDRLGSPSRRGKERDERDTGPRRIGCRHAPHHE